MPHNGMMTEVSLSRFVDRCICLYTYNFSTTAAIYSANTAHHSGVTIVWNPCPLTFSQPTTTHQPLSNSINIVKNLTKSDIQSSFFSSTFLSASTPPITLFPTPSKIPNVSSTTSNIIQCPTPFKLSTLTSGRYPYAH